MLRGLLRGLALRGPVEIGVRGEIQLRRLVEFTVAGFYEAEEHVNVVLWNQIIVVV